MLVAFKKIFTTICGFAQYRVEKPSKTRIYDVQLERLRWFQTEQKVTNVPTKQFAFAFSNFSFNFLINKKCAKLTILQQLAVKRIVIKITE